MGKKVNNIVTKEGEKYAFEDNSDKKDEQDSDVHKITNEQVNKNEQKK